MGGVGASTVEVGGAGGRGGAVNPEGPGASREVWRTAPVEGEGRGCELHYTVYNMNTQTGKLPTEPTMAHSMSVWVGVCLQNLATVGVSGTVTSVGGGFMYTSTHGST